MFTYLIVVLIEPHQTTRDLDVDKTRTFKKSQLMALIGTCIIARENSVSWREYVIDTRRCVGIIETPLNNCGCAVLVDD